jgi:hypothetical protein
VDNPTCSKNSPCKHVQQAVDVASVGDTVSLATGNYVEQVSIAKDLTLTGAGSGASTISAPAVLVPDSQGFLNIVEINSGASVQMSRLAVDGPGPGTCGSIDRGISVIGGRQRVRAGGERDTEAGGGLAVVDHGEVVGAGTQLRNGGQMIDPEVGHLTIDHTTLTGYQRAAIFVANVGSTGQIDHNTIEGAPCTFPCNGPGGIGVFSGASATIDHNTISGNECNDPTLGAARTVQRPQSFGVLGRGCLVDDLTQQPEHERRGSTPTPGSRSTTTTWPPLVRHRHRLRERGAGRSQLDDRRHLRIWTRRNRHLQPQLGERQLGADLWWAGTVTPSCSHNSCGTASPSKAIWGCH